ncbi:hypothetical protein IQ07DRAFT_599951 [Pyrenochaeta sp. DS3sAY3a]|nr:hypothetical protein IQ07DRAFT_599951 [Pyrenochaeta sp. DS3sAY3a]
MALQSSLAKVSHLFDNVNFAELFSRHRGATLAALGLAVITPFAIRDYLTYLSYGPGGLPYNAFGWLMSHSFRVLTREQLSTGAYDDRSLYRAERPGLLQPDFPPHRTPARPQFGPHPVPQRQVSQLPDEETRKKLISRFEALGKTAQEKGLVEIKQSILELRHSALFVSKKRDWHPVAQQMRGEITHVHAGVDGSVHVTLHPDDCKKIIERGWGQRHGFSGVNAIKRIAGFSLPVTYVLVYAPRDETEIEVVLTIVKASVAFMSGSSLELE